MDSEKNIYETIISELFGEVYEIIPNSDNVIIKKSSIKNENIQDNSVYSRFIVYVANKIIVEDDREVFLSNYSKEAVDEFLKSGDEIRSSHVRLKEENTTGIWNEAYLYRCVNSDKLVFIMKKMDRLMQQIIKRKAIYENCNYIVGIEKNTGKFSIYCGSEYLKRIKEKTGCNNYDTMLDISFYHTFIKKNANKYLRDLSLKSIISKLERNNDYNVYVDGYFDNEIYHKKCRFIYYNDEKTVILLTVLDVTEEIENEKKKQRVLQHTLDKLRELIKQRSDFTSRIGHDIRTPLSGIKSVVTLIKRHPENREMVLRGMEDIENATDFLLLLFDEINTINRLSQNRFIMENKPFSMRETLEGNIAILKGNIKEKSHNITYDIDNIYHDIVLGDKKRVAQIILNLLSNSIKYTPEGGNIYLEVTELGVEDEGKVVFQLIVKDDGIGIESKFQQKVFHPFFREIDTRINKIPGTGLGLSIVKEIVERMDGSIELTSKKGYGTEFRVILKLKEEKSNKIIEKDSGIEIF